MIRVLIVDDEPPARNRLRSLVADEADLDLVGESGDGQDALTKIGTLRPDLVLLDIHLPGMSGLALSRALHGSDVPFVIFTTAYSEHALEAFEVDAVDYLTKPFDQARFRQAIDKVRRRHGSTPQDGQAISQIIQAIQDVEAGRIPAPISEQGGSGLSRVAREFNALVNKLEHLDAERQLMLAGISHDLRTPLTRIRLGIEIATRKSDIQLAEGLAQDIEEMDAMLSILLDQAKSDDDELLEVHDLTHLITEVSDRYIAAGHALTRDLMPVKPFGFRLMSMRRLMINLLDNAVKYGEKDIYLTVENHGNRVIIRVADRGPGIPEGDLDKAVRPYVRTDSRVFKKGTGLGLYIASRIVQAHSGALRLSNRPGGGLEVNVEIPYSMAPRRDGAAP